MFSQEAFAEPGSYWPIRERETESFKHDFILFDLISEMLYLRNLWSWNAKSLLNNFHPGMTAHKNFLYGWLVGNPNQRLTNAFAYSRTRLETLFALWLSSLRHKWKDSSDLTNLQHFLKLQICAYQMLAFSSFTVCDKALVTLSARIPQGYRTPVQFPFLPTGR